VRLAALVAAKDETYRATCAEAVNKTELVRRMGIAPQRTQWLFEIHHASRLDQIEAALAALGRRLIITSGTT
jgi:antitoxin HicB